MSTGTPEIKPKDDARNIVAQIEDLKIEDMLKNTKEFAPCRDMYKIEAGLKEAERTDRINKAEDCLKKQLGGNSSLSKQRLEELSHQLNLQHYGLVKSKNVKDIQKYLNDKMYKAMTGVSLEEKNLQKMKEDLKFGKRKMIDQGIFIQMYKTQLGKNALHEISRFCFEDLRITANDKKETFAEHWADFTKTETININDVDDFGKPQFGKISDPSDKNKVYEDLFNSIQNSSNQLSNVQLEKFFEACGGLIVPLCEEFQKNIKLADPTKSQTDAPSSPTKGSAACLAKSRIQDYRLALLNVEKVAEEFKKMESSDKALQILVTGIKGEPIKFFGDGKDPNEESIDSLTSFTSKDIVEGGYTEDELAKKKADECMKKPELSSCEGFVFDNEKFDMAKQKVELEMTVKREVEMERVRKIVAGNKADIEKYLEDNGHMDILKDLKANPQMTPDQIAERVGVSFEAKKRALLEQLNSKLGKRQVAKDANGQPTPVSQQNAKDIVDESKEERARLAQVVLFNNIITSHIQLKKKDGSPVGRNVGAWKKEEKDLAAAQVNSQFFTNLKTTDQDQGIGKNDQIAGFGILDSILGKPPEKPNGQGSN